MIKIDYQKIKSQILEENWVSHRYDVNGELIGWLTSLQDEDGHIVIHYHNKNGELIEIQHIHKSPTTSENMSANKKYNEDYIKLWKLKYNQKTGAS